MPSTISIQIRKSNQRIQPVYNKKGLWPFIMRIKSFKKTFLKWVRTSANFVEVPWLIIEPKGSIIPSAWNILFQALFSQRKVFVFSWFILKIGTHFYLLLESINLFYFKIVYLILKLTGKNRLAFLLAFVVLLEKWRCSDKGGYFLFANTGIHLWKTWFLVW